MVTTQYEALHPSLFQIRLIRMLPTATAKPFQTNSAIALLT